VSLLDAEASADSLLVNRHGSLGYMASSPCTPQSLKSEYHLAVNTALVWRHTRGIQVCAHALFAKHIPDTFEKYWRVASLEEGVEQVKCREQQIFRGNCTTSSSVDGHFPYTFPLHISLTPRPANVDVAALLQQPNKGEDDTDYTQVQHLINAELVQLNTRCSTDYVRDSC